MDRKNKIPETDMKDINDTFKKDAPADTLKKGPTGGKVSQPKKEIVNKKGYVFNDYGGRVLKHGKSLIPKGGKQVVIGCRGQRYDDIPLEQRKRVAWFDSDFK